MEELKKVFPNAEIEVVVDSTTFTQYGITIPLYATIRIKDIAKFDENAAMCALESGIYFSVIFDK